MGSDDYTVRLLNPGDLDVVVSLDRVRGGEGDPEWWERRLAACSEVGDTFGVVAEAGGAPMAFAMGEVRAWEFGSEPTGWIYAIGVLPDWEGRGVGASLVRALEARMEKHGATSIRTMVNESDPLLTGFFGSLGYGSGPYRELELLPGADAGSPSPAVDAGAAAHAADGGGLRISRSHDGRLARFTLDNGKGNILDRALIARLDKAFRAIEPGVRAVLLDAAGPHFSFGASVPEHAPDQVDVLLHEFHRFARRVVTSNVPIACVVSGQCLGGGLELASLAHWITASPDAHFGQPEIRLGVFAPLASVLLPLRIGGARAEDLLLTGRSITAETAHQWGLVREVADDPEKASLDFLESSVLGQSGAAMRMASRAARTRMHAAVHGSLDQVERLYLEELMSTHDAVEGIHAFMARRDPLWRDR